MAFQPETATYDAGVLQLEATTPVQGGVGGAANAPLLNLSNRTAYLKQHVDSLETAFTGLAPINSPAFTGSPTVPDVAAGDSSGKAANTKFVQNAVGGILTKSVAGNSNVTLTATECGFAIIVLTGVLTGNISVIVPSGAGTSDEWIFYNNTTGNFTVTVKTAAGAGVLLSQTQSYVLYCDTVDVRAAGAANQNSFALTKFIATGGQTTFSVLYTPGNVLVTKNGSLLTTVDDYVAVSGADIGMTVGCAAGDEVNVYAFSSFTVANAIAKAGDTMLGALNLITAAQFDNTTKAASTAFVQRALGSYASTANLSASTALTVAHVGCTVLYLGTTAGQTITMPALSGVPEGASIELVNVANTPVTIAGAGADLIGQSRIGLGVTSSSSISLGIGDHTTLVRHGGNWSEIGSVRSSHLSSLACGSQTWQDVLVGRAVSTAFTNTTGRAIAVAISGTAGGAPGGYSIQVNGVVAANTSVATGLTFCLSAIIPAGASYILTKGGADTLTLIAWAELR